MAGSLAGMTTMCCVLDWHNLMLSNPRGRSGSHFPFWCRSRSRSWSYPFCKFWTCWKIWSFLYFCSQQCQFSWFFLSRHHRKCHNFQYFGQYIRQNYTDPTGSGSSTFLENLIERLSKSEWQVVTNYLCNRIEPCGSKELARQMSRLLKFQFLRGGMTKLNPKWTNTWLNKS